MNQKAKKHLSSVDPILAKVIAQIKMPEHKPSRNHFRSLVESIVSQQLSVKASDTIFKRFVQLFGRFPKPEQVLKMTETKMRQVGLSASKVKYIKDLAKKVHRKELQLRRLQKMTDQEVIEYLIQVKGIGRWTGEMFLMFSLQRPDVFSHGDLGLRNAIKKLYKLETPTQKQIERIVAKWTPHKTTASRYLWKSLNNE